MRKIQASEAKVHLRQLLDEVERGETLIITRHGRHIARIVPEVDRLHLAFLRMRTDEAVVPMPVVVRGAAYPRA
jgi:prevent-host-death family protein